MLRLALLTGVARRRRFTTEQKLAVVAETMQPGLTISYVARRHGLSPSLVFRWRRLMSEGGKEAVRGDDEVVAASEVRRLEDRVRELERLLGRKTKEVEILKEALDLARAKKPAAECSGSRVTEVSPFVLSGLSSSVQLRRYGKLLQTSFRGLGIWPMRSSEN
jgi:transposase